MSELATLRANGLAGPLDLQLARLLGADEAANGRDGTTADIVALSAALVSQQRERGHSCIELDDWAGQPWAANGEDDPADLPRLPKITAWRRALKQAHSVGDGTATTPLVLEGKRLYLYRYWRAEQNLAANLRARLEQPLRTEFPKTLRQAFVKVFGKPDKAIDWQAVAAEAALCRSFTIITGGPGTGKTTTVARIITLLRSLDPNLRIALTAPTGKAAARMKEAIDANLPADIAGAIPTKASTIHRLLRRRRGSDNFVHGPRHLLAQDVVIVDEASMIDLLLMDALLQAVRPTARVILLGDRHQLASVEAGNVLGDLCDAAGLNASNGYAPAFAEAVRDLGGIKLPVAKGKAGRSGAAIELLTNYRFKEGSGIGEIAAAVKTGNAKRTIKALNVDDEQVALQPLPDDREKILQPILPALKHYLDSPTPEEALQRLKAFRLLCAVRRGPWGVEGLNDLVESVVDRRDEGRATQHLQPVLVDTNDYTLGLFNGDIGVCWHDDSGLSAYFDSPQGPDAAPRRFAVAALPPHQPAWAMTVHRSQGSEFDHVAIVLPDRDNRVLSRELLYTAVTRARRKACVWSPEAVLAEAVGRTASRGSGLAERLHPTS